MKLVTKALSYKLQLAQPFTTSRYTVETQNTVIVSISNGIVTGYGEATANPYYKSSVEGIIAAVTSVNFIIENSFGQSPEALWYKLEPHLRNNYFALCAIDCAYWDFYGKSKDKTLRSFWNSTTTDLPKSNFTIGIDTLEVMKNKIINKPWPIYKIKLGTKDDVQIVKELRRITDSVFRVDANCNWTVEQTIINSVALKSMNVEFIEQPLNANDWSGMKTLKQKSKLPVIADESCQRLEDIEPCGNHFHGINIKLMKCGGITPALRMITLSRKLNLKVMAGCMTESSIGISNLVQLAPLLDYLDADGAMLLKSDVARGVDFVDGKIQFSSEKGSGAQLLKPRKV